MWARIRLRWTKQIKSGVFASHAICLKQVVGVTTSELLPVLARLCLRTME